MSTEDRSFLFLDDPILDVDVIDRIEHERINERGSMYSNLPIVDGGLSPRSVLGLPSHLAMDSSSFVPKEGFSFLGPFHSTLTTKIFGCRSGLDEERLRWQEGAKWVIHPCSYFRFVWLLAMVTLLAVSLVLVPVYLAYFTDDQSARTIVFHCLFDLIFFVDVILNFMTGSIKSDFTGTILSLKKIAIHYGTTFFILDLISCMPFDYMFLLSKSNQSYGSLLHAGRALRLLRSAKLLGLARLLRIMRLARYVLRLEEFFRWSQKSLRILNAMLLVALLVHWCTCLQFFVPMLFDFHVKSWVVKISIQNDPWTNQYLWSLYKAASTMMSLGYGQEPPTLLSEALTVTATAATGTFAAALLVASLVQWVIFSDLPRTVCDARVREMEGLLVSERVPKSLRSRTVEHFLCSRRGHLFTGADAFETLAPQLKGELLRHEYGGLLRGASIFGTANSEFMLDLAGSVTVEIFPPEASIVRQGAVEEKMYFIKKGSLEVLLDGSVVTADLSAGDNLGEICLLAKSRRLFGIRAKTCCHLYSLERHTFLEVLARHPSAQGPVHEASRKALLAFFRSPFWKQLNQDLTVADRRRTVPMNSLDDEKVLERHFQRSIYEIKSKLQRELSMVSRKEEDSFGISRYANKQSHEESRL